MEIGKLIFNWLIVMGDISLRSLGIFLLYCRLCLSFCRGFKSIFSPDITHTKDMCIEHCAKYHLATAKLDITFETKLSTQMGQSHSPPRAEWHHDLTLHCRGCTVVQNLSACVRRHYLASLQHFVSFSTFSSWGLSLSQRHHTLTSHYHTLLSALLMLMLMLMLNCSTAQCSARMHEAGYRRCRLSPSTVLQQICPFSHFLSFFKLLLKCILVHRLLRGNLKDYKCDARQYSLKSNSKMFS